MQRQPQVGVGVHPDEGTVPVTLQQVSRASLPLRTNHLPYDDFAALGRALFTEEGNMAVEFGDQSVQGHSCLVVAGSCSV